MTEVEWLTCDVPERMVRDVLEHLTGDRSPRPWRLPRARQSDLFCAACYRAIRHLVPDTGTARAMEWMEENAGREDGPSEFEEQLEEHAQAVKDWSECEGNSGAQAMAARVAEELWCGALEIPMHWFCRGFREMYPGTLAPDAPASLAVLLRDIFGNPFRPVAFSPSWRTDTAVSLAKQMYESRDFSAMPILADALQDAGCDNEEILNHCRGDGPHVRGCWVVDLVLGKE
jgi:hypothetical protein